MGVERDVEDEVKAVVGFWLARRPVIDVDDAHK
jgi:hypothetical protein